MPQDFYHIIHNHKVLNTIQRKYHHSESVDSEAYVSLKQKYDEDQDILKNSLKQIALMVEERDRFRILTDEYQKKNALFIDEFVSLLMELIEKKLSYHGGHSGKVKDISSFIAKEMKLPEKMCKYIESAASLHELGKLLLPDSITQKKPDKYQTYERNFVNHHPVNGASLLSKVSQLNEVSLIVRQIHENYDGSGYPDGLSKNDIHIGARIIKIASAFDNLMNRDHAVSVGNALKKIEKNVGLLYDSEIIHPLGRYISQVEQTVRDGIVNEISIYGLMPGMELSSGIYTRDGAKLLPESTVLTEEWINKISEFNKKEPLKETVFIKRAE